VLGASARDPENPFHPVKPNKFLRQDPQGRDVDRQVLSKTSWRIWIVISAVWDEAFKRSYRERIKRNIEDFKGIADLVVIY
jgi:hypothetical protein